jgi:hypothetical protein
MDVPFTDEDILILVPDQAPIGFRLTMLWHRSNLVIGNLAMRLVVAPGCDKAVEEHDVMPAPVCMYYCHGPRSGWVRYINLGHALHLH